jgi:hypothetical protein
MKLNKSLTNHLNVKLAKRLYRKVKRGQQLTSQDMMDLQYLQDIKR